MKSREPAIRAKVTRLRAAHPLYTSDQLARELIRSTRRRVAATGALSGAAAIAPGLGTVLAIGTVTSQTLYALEQEIELVLGIAMIFGHELSGSEDRVLEALVVVGLTSGALKLREDVLVAGGERMALAAFRRVPNMLLVRHARPDALCHHGHCQAGGPRRSPRGRDCGRSGLRLARSDGARPRCDQVLRPGRARRAPAASCP